MTAYSYGLRRYGHMERTDLGIIPWQEVDKVPMLKGAIKS